MLVIGVDIYVLFLNDHPVKLGDRHDGIDRIAGPLLRTREFAVCFQHFGETIDGDFMALRMSRSEFAHS